MTGQESKKSSRWWKGVDIVVIVVSIGFVAYASTNPSSSGTMKAFTQMTAVGIGYSTVALVLGLLIGTIIYWIRKKLFSEDGSSRFGFSVGLFSVIGIWLWYSAKITFSSEVLGALFVSGGTVKFPTSEALTSAQRLVNDQVFDYGLIPATLGLLFALGVSWMLRNRLLIFCYSNFWLLIFACFWTEYVNLIARV